MEKNKTLRVLVLGASGMLGNAVFRLFSQSADIETFGTVRSTNVLGGLNEAMRQNIITNVDVENIDNITRVFSACRPDVVVNCVGVVKQLSSAKDPLISIPINSILPHRLAALCELSNARLVHISTDCVFSGSTGGYREADMPDATDLYGRTKLLGEVDGPNAITLRTSIIGHELNGAHSLVDWFLSQSGRVKGFRRAIFSGLPTCELAKVIRDFVLPNQTLRGLYHVASEPIDKFTLLNLIASRYGSPTEIDVDEALVIDRSLNAERFASATGYTPPKWPELIERMHAFG